MFVWWDSSAITVALDRVIDWFTGATKTVIVLPITEDRIFIVPYQKRRFEVSEKRTFTVFSDIRAFQVHSDNRKFATHHDNRVFIVPAD